MQNQVQNQISDTTLGNSDIQEPLLQNRQQNLKNRPKEHNLLFTLLTPLIKRVNIQQKNFLKAKKLADKLDNNEELEKLQKEQTLKTSQITEFLTQNTDPENLVQKIEDYIAKNGGKYSVFSMIRHMTIKQFFVGAFFTTIDQSCSITASIFLNYLTDALENKKIGNNVEIAIGYLVGIIGLYFIKTFVQVRYDWTQIKWKSQTKITIQYLLYKKALKTKMFTSNKSEEDENEESADINNLMTVDIDEIINFFWSFHWLWTSSLMIVVSLYLIYLQLGDAVYDGIIVVIGAIVFNMIVGLSMMALFEKMMGHKDKRVALITDLIEGMKSIKYLGWEKVFEKKILEIRRKEYNILWAWRGLDGCLGIFWNMLSSFLCYMFLISYTDKGHKLEDTNIFVVMLLFALLMFPLGILPWCFGILYKCRVSYLRVRQYLEENEINKDEIQFYNNNNKKNDFYDDDDNDNDNNNKNIIQSRENQQKNNSIEIKKMEFQWPTRKIVDLKKKKEFEENSKDRFTLKIDNLKIQQGKLTFVIGKIGCGKSALFQAILNEMDNKFKENNIKQNGGDTRESEILTQSFTDDAVDVQKLLIKNSFVKVYGTIGYVSQNHWLQNMTVKENIIFGKQFDKQWYQKCIQVSQLEHDLKQWSNRDQKLIGPQGSNLSGGQKQRISICRALYQDCDIYLFDDIFSSLDTNVADKLYEEGIKKMLIQEKQKTVIMVSSQYKYLMQDYENLNVVFMQNGQIVNDKDQINKYLEKEWELQKKKIEEQEKLHEQELNDGDHEESHDLMLKKKLSSNKHKHIKKKSLEEEQELIVDDDQYEDTDEEEDEKNEEYRDQGKVSWSTLKTYFGSMNWGLLTGWIIFNFFMEITHILTDFWLKSRVSPDDHTFDALDNYFNNDFKKTYMFLIILNFMCTSLRMFFYVLAAQLSAYILFLRLNNTIIFSNMKFFDKNPNGRIINRLSNDVLVTDDELPWFLHVLLESVSTMICSPIAIALQIPAMIVFFIVSFFLIFMVQNIFRASNRELKRLNSINEGKLLTLLNEICKGVQVVRSFQKEQKVMKDYIARMKDCLSTWVLSQAVFTWMQVRLLLISDIVISSLCLLFITLLLIDYDFNYTTLVFTLQYAIILSDYFYNVVYNLCQSEQRIVSVERMRQYFENNITEKLNQVIQPQNYDQIENNQYKDYSIVFENVRLTYDEKKDQQIIDNEQQNSDNNKIVYALDGINLQIKKGEKIAFVGRTGSGKTSILNVLYRMYEIEKDGKVFLDGQNIQFLSLNKLRQKLSIIPQFGFLYNSSFKNNLDPNEHYSEQELKTIVDQTGLHIKKTKKKEKNSNNEENNNALEIDNELQNNEENIGLDFEIEDSGNNLSNGEKQIINYLRITLRQQDIICLDEATSNMDPKTDQLLHDKLFEFTKNKTLLVITHRLENIDKFDRVIVLDKGKIVEQGKFSELKKNENGFFNKLMQH